MQMLFKGKVKISITFIVFLLIITGYFIIDSIKDVEEVSKPRIRSSSSPKAGVKSKAARQEYFHRLLRDPKTNQIPPQMRRRELEYAKKLRDLRTLNKNSGNNIFWQFAGPDDVGGRTRALAVDVTNANTLIAGGVSGGIWKSTNGGDTWSLKNTVLQPLSVTSLAQDTRDGHTDTWYYSTGEYFNGNSASDRGRVAHFFGTGIYKSTNNGESWTLLNATVDNYPHTWNVPSFDIVTRVYVSPTTGTLFTANNGVGIYRSTDGGNSFSIVLGNGSTPRYADVVVTNNGTVIGTYSQNSAGTSPVTNPGIYKSTSDGVVNSWTDITPDYLKNNNNNRTVLAIAPSNNDILYSLTLLPTGELKFYKIIISTGVNEDRSGNLTEFPERGALEAQGGYNMVLGVKPDDENFVLLGLTNLFRSRNGFATKPGQEDEADVFIGGYHNNDIFFYYPNNHPDHHVLAFDPTNPNRLWNGNDGGIYMVEDIRESLTGNELLPWIDKNQGYNVTQFYTASIANIADDDRIMGGTQDNGSPYFTFNGTNTSSSDDVGSGDGSYGYFGNTYAYASSQEGRILRRAYSAGGAPTGAWATVYPSNAGGQLFVNPFRVDPNNENYMYYPSGSEFWRNNALSSIPTGVNGGTTVGWSEVAGLEETGDFIISAIQISQQPAHILYYGSSSDVGLPKITRVTSSLSASTGETVTLSGAEEGAYVHDIAINPDNADQILVVISNYNTESLFYSSNGGQSFSTVQGNLSGDQKSQGSYTYWTGPSMRSATIVPTEDGLVYLVGTSTGVYSTTSLIGDNTEWVQESDELIGNTVTEYIDSREVDATIVAGTHGRGIFIGKYDTSLSSGRPPSSPGAYHLSQNYPNPFNPGTTIEFTVPEAMHVVITVYDLNGREVGEIFNQQVIGEGPHFASFNSINLASGIYYYTLKAGSYQATKKMIVLK
jgi:hypothetical protein